MGGLLAPVASFSLFTAVVLVVTVLCHVWNETTVVTRQLLCSRLVTDLQMCVSSIFGCMTTIHLLCGAFTAREGQENLPRTIAVTILHNVPRIPSKDDSFTHCPQDYAHIPGTNTQQAGHRHHTQASTGGVCVDTFENGRDVRSLAADSDQRS